MCAWAQQGNHGRPETILEKCSRARTFPGARRAAVWCAGAPLLALFFSEGRLRPVRWLPAAPAAATALLLRAV